MLNVITPVVITGVESCPHVHTVPKYFWDTDPISETTTRTPLLLPLLLLLLLLL